jgi:hypothetical protein
MRRIRIGAKREGVYLPRERDVDVYFVTTVA